MNVRHSMGVHDKMDSRLFYFCVTISTLKVRKNFQILFLTVLSLRVTKGHTYLNKTAGKS